MAWRQRTLHVLIVGAAAFSLGALDSLLKGQGTGLLGALSEVVVPWFLLAFVAGASTSGRRYGFGAFIGVVATMSALIGFYFVNSFIFSYWATNLLSGFHEQILGGAIYFKLGIVSGSLCGAFGVWWKQHLSMVPVIALGAAFVIEAVARASMTSHVFADQVAVIELIVGALWIALSLVATLELRHRHGARRLT
jgi:hypothetical protein